MTDDRTVVRVELGERSYDIVIGTGVVAELPSQIERLELGNDVFVVTSPTVRRFWGETLSSTLDSPGLRVRFFEFEDDEEHKSLETYRDALTALLEFDEGRRICVVAFGGGVVGDLAGFVAATFKRGLNVDFVQVPTTLLGHVDCSVGGKVAVNLAHAKNMVGCFHQPRLVLIDLRFLSTLPRRELLSGMAEVIKYGVILDREFFDFVEARLDDALALRADVVRHISARSCELKARVVAADELDRSGVRAALNFGHTIGHAIEGATGGKLYTHGEAVAIGMACAADIACELDMFARDEAERLVRLLERTGFDLTVRECSLDEIVEYMRHDKKATKGRVRFVLPTRIGEVRLVDDVPSDVVKRAIAKRLP